MRVCPGDRALGDADIDIALDPTLSQDAPGDRELQRHLLQRAETRKALDDPQITAQVEAFGLFIVGSRPDEFAAIIRRESEVMGKLIKSLGIVPE